MHEGRGVRGRAVERAAVRVEQDLAEPERARMTAPATAGIGVSTYWDLPQKFRRGTSPSGFSICRAHCAAAYWVHWAQNEIASA